MSSRGTPKASAPVREALRAPSILTGFAPSSWIDAEQGIAFTAAVRRVRDGLVLRPVPAAGRVSGKARSDARGHR